MFWFWFHLIEGLVMLVLDVASIVVAWRLTKRRSWRIIAGIFFGVQTLALFTLMCDFNWHLYAPRFIYIGVYLWDFLGLSFFWTILFLFACWRFSRRIIRKIKSQSLPAPTAISEASVVSRREF